VLKLKFKNRHLTVVDNIHPANIMTSCSRQLLSAMKMWVNCKSPRMFRSGGAVIC